MPIAAIISGKIFCCHGGISPLLESMDQIRDIQRPTDVPTDGIMCDLLWSDPGEHTGFEESDRKISYTFGADAVSTFLQKYGFDMICRAHECVDDGFKFFANFQLVTIFSAPNYDGQNNAGAIMSVDETLKCSFQILRPFIGLFE